MYELKLLTKSAGIVIEKYDSAAETVEQLEIRLTAKYGTFIQLDVNQINPLKPCH